MLNILLSRVKPSETVILVELKMSAFHNHTYGVANFVLCLQLLVFDIVVIC